MSVQLCQAGGENPHCSKEAIHFYGGANWCQHHYEIIRKIYEAGQEWVAKQKGPS